MLTARTAAARIAAVLNATVLVAALTVGAGWPVAPASADPTDSTVNPAGPTVDGFTYQPLWPFGSQAEADRWLRDGGAAGAAPWHAEPTTTAVKFAQGYLGFGDLDQVIAVTEHVAEAWVRVGYLLPGGRAAPAGTIHLVRFGTAPDAPWEVVGTLDDTLSLLEPQYGSTVGSVIGASGIITGVDESLQLQVRQSGHDQVLGSYCCLAAGGQSQPWSATFGIAPPQPGVLTLVVWTGGHVTDVERFAVTGLRTQ